MEKGTVLVVDDTEVNIDILVGLLKKFDVIPALSGEDALEIAKNEAVDLILLDIMMPDMDGYEVCETLKQNSKTRDIPIIFITAKTTEADIGKGFDMGAVDYVTKPFNPTELLSRVKTHLELYHYRQNLEKRVQEEIRENSLKEQLLYQHSKQAAIGELLMHIAHQWKQPLSELGAMNLYTLGKLNFNKEIAREELEKNCKQTEKIVTFMSDTVETFQNFYKPSSEKSLFFVADAIKEAFQIVSATFDFYNIKFELKQQANPQVYGNANEYAQVVLNLLNNAKDIFLHHQSQDPVVTVTIDQQQNRSVVTVADNGGGIEQEHIDSIFEPFVSMTESSGIGLHMSRNILAKNGGTLRVKNDENGAVFRIEL